MQHFKEFLIKLQTIDIKVLQRKTGSDEREKIIRYYDISHQNPYLSVPYKNELMEIKELAITDILNLPLEQIRFQMARLNDLKRNFGVFWDRYNSRYNHIPRPILDPEDEGYVLSHLDLTQLFIAPSTSFLDHAKTSMYFIDDLICSIRHRQKVLKEFDESILNVIKPEKEPDTSPILEPVLIKSRSRPVFREEIADQFFKILREYFIPEDQESFQTLLTSNKSPAQPLVFNGPGNQLADGFKQLIDSNLIVSCNKAELENWIRQNFQYRDKGRVKSYTEKYLQDIISSNTKACQSPLFDVMKKDGKFLLVPLIRNNRKGKR
jgi:hypothetical protein